MKKIKIGAAIIERDYAEIKNKFNKVKKFVDFVQVDVCDGDFVPSKTFASSGLASSFKKIAKIQNKDTKLELDMMVSLSEAGTRQFIRWMSAIKVAKPSCVALHYSSTNSWSEVFDALGKDVEKIGLAVHIDHPLASVKKLLNRYDFAYVQVMGIDNVGFGGQKFSTKAYAKIRAIRKAFPKIGINVDGSVKVDNIAKLAEAGANRVASGSGIFKYKDGIKKAVELMRT